MEVLLVSSVSQKFKSNTRCWFSVTQQHNGEQPQYHVWIKTDKQLTYYNRLSQIFVLLQCIITALISYSEVIYDATILRRTLHSLYVNSKKLSDTVQETEALQDQI